MSSDDDDSNFSDEDIPLTSLKKKKAAKKPKAAKKKASKPDAVVSTNHTKKRKSSSGSSSAKKPAAKKAKTENGDKKPKALKKLEKTDRMQYAMSAFCWWEAHDPPPGCQWSTMEHAGVSFPEPYESHGVKMLYDGVEVDLTPAQEEA